MKIAASNFWQYACMYLVATINNLQVTIIDRIQYDINFDAKNVKANTVAEMALMGQADHISIMVPLEVLVQQQK